ncbi:protein of unknown function [Cyanobium sp. NIES-981]|nr:protein of unknown function [Cyanobium sp. NIES-981]
MVRRRITRAGSRPGPWLRIDARSPLPFRAASRLCSWPRLGSAACTARTPAPLIDSAGSRAAAESRDASSRRRPAPAAGRWSLGRGRVLGRVNGRERGLDKSMPELEWLLS